MATLSSRIERAAESGRAITFAGSSDPVRVSWGQLHSEARQLAAVFQDRGISLGDHVALLGPTSRQLVTAIQATWLAGATAVVLPLPMRMGSIEEFVLQTRQRVLQADSALLVADPSLESFLAPKPGDPPIVYYADLFTAAAEAGPYQIPKEDLSSLAILQFTSGSTSDPKGVMLPQHCVLNNVDAIASGVHLDPSTDVVVSWLPLYHDMGLIGLLTTAMTTGTEMVLAAPQDFLASPARWMQWMSDFGGTITAGPNFSYALAARALRRMDGLDLSSWRLAANGAEGIDPSTMDELEAAGAPFGYHAGAAFCVFGMAEATLAVTFPEPGEGMRRDSVNRLVLESERYAAPVDEATDPANVRHFASLGRPVAGIEIRVVEPETGRLVDEREVGELEIRGNSVTPGYYRRPDATEAAFREDWFRTGDLAYLVDGELIICGRLKDIIIVGGRNIFPEDVEKAVATVEGVRAGNVIAFGVQRRKGKEAIVVVAETKASECEPIRSEASARIRDSVGLPAEIVLVQAGTLPKTSSGKLQRSLCRSRYLEQALSPVG